MDISVTAGTQFISDEMSQWLEQTYFLMPTWKWLALAIAVIGLGFLRTFLVGFISYLKKVPKIPTENLFLTAFLKLEIERGLSIVVASFIGLILLDAIHLTDAFEKYLVIFLKICLGLNLIRVVYLAAEAMGESIKGLAKKTESTIDDQLAPLATKTLKVLVVIIGCLVILQNFGVNVTALLAGLGIGGIAIAFAAQDTVANVFGTITILLDTPFKLHDRIKVGDTDGIVEEVGFRSTRIRTMYNSVVIIPNSVLAKEKIDNLTERNNCLRFRHVFGVTYDATPEQVNSLTDAIKYFLFQDSTIDKTRIVVALNEFAESSINILVNFHYNVKMDENDADRNHYYLKEIQKMILNLKMDFAFPTRTMIIQNKTIETTATN